MSELDPKGIEAARAAFRAAWARGHGTGVCAPEWMEPAITAYLSTVSPLSDGDGWQPIETAPKDGRSVMVWIASTAMARAHCLAPVSICDDGSWWDDETGDQIEPIASAYLWAPIHPPKSPAPPRDEVK